MPPRSQGADLGSLLEDADVQFGQAFYRFRAALQDLTAEAPPLGATQQQEQVGRGGRGVAGGVERGLGAGWTGGQE